MSIKKIKKISHMTIHNYILFIIMNSRIIYIEYLKMYKKF